MPKSKQVVPSYFRGTWNHPEKHELLSEGVITGTEFVLLAVVDKHVEYKGQGCWASNATLAKEVGCEVRQVQRMVRHLLGLGLLIQTGWKEEEKGIRLRIMETKWNGSKSEAPPVSSMTPGVIDDTQSSSSSSLRSEQAEEPGAETPRGSRRRKDNPGMEDSIVPFWTEEVKTRYTKTDAARAQQLRSSITKWKLSLVNWNSTKWADEFRILREQVEKAGMEDKIIQVRLDWYCSYLDRVSGKVPSTVPRILSASHFRKPKVFEWLKDVMEKDLKDNPTVEVSAEAKKLAAAVDHLKWPKGTFAKMEVCMQRSIDGLTEIYEKLEHLRDTADNPTRVRTAKTILTNLEANPRFGFLKNWWVEVFHNVSDWADWSGNLDPYILCLTSKRFTQVAREWIEQRGRSAKDWDDVAEVLNEG